MLKEFKDFINKGNVFDAAVGLIMALAFKPIIDSMVADIVMPIVARVFSAPDFSDLKIGLGGLQEVVLDNGETVMQEPSINYGIFIEQVISFVIIAFVVFMMVKAYNRATRRDTTAGPTEVDLLTQIRDELAKRPA